MVRLNINTTSVSDKLKKELTFSRCNGPKSPNTSFKTDALLWTVVSCLTTISRSHQVLLRRTGGGFWTLFTSCCLEYLHPNLFGLLMLLSRVALGNWALEMPVRVLVLCSLWCRMLLQTTQLYDHSQDDPSSGVCTIIKVKVTYVHVLWSLTSQMQHESVSRVFQCGFYWLEDDMNGKKTENHKHVRLIYKERNLPTFTGSWKLKQTDGSTSYSVENILS